MWRYLLKRILWFIPTLFIITLLGFIITINAPGDPVDNLLKAADDQTSGNSGYRNTEVERQRWRKKLGLDLPVFYLKVTPLSEPDTLYKIPVDAERIALKRLSRKYGNWTTVSAYYLNLKAWYRAHGLLRKDSALINQYEANEVTDAINQSTIAVLNLPTVHDLEVVSVQLEELSLLYSKYTFFHPLKDYLETASESIITISKTARPFRSYFPAFRLHWHNQYHRWLFGDGNMLTGKGHVYSKGVLRGDFGLSYAYMEPVGKVIRRRIGWTLFFTLFAVVMGYLVSVPIGLKAAQKKDRWFDRFSSVGLFILYSIPNFFMATLLQLFFSGTGFFGWFETTGVKPTIGYPEGAGLLDKIWVSLPFLVLPAICYTYTAFAFLSRTTRVSALEVLNMDFIRTARAKGLSESKVLYKHTFRNALFPLITIFAEIFPVAIGGSVILEYIFGIPGMGQESYEAIGRKDYPIIVAVFTLTGILTLVGYLVSDILYAIADPRINYRNRE